MTGALRPPAAPTLPVGTLDLLASIEAAAEIAARACVLMNLAAGENLDGDHEAARRHTGEAADLLVRASTALGRRSGDRPAAGPLAEERPPENI